MKPKKSNKYKYIIIGAGTLAILFALSQKSKGEGEPPIQETKFITIGDLHANRSGQLQKVTNIVNFINQSDANAAIFLGDISGELGNCASGGDGCDLATYSTIKTELDKLNKPYYVLAGNHDNSQCECTTACIADDTNYYRTFDYYNKIVDIHGIQFIIASWCDATSHNAIFNQANKNKPTVVFTHGPVMCGNNSGSTNCKCTNGANWADYFYTNFPMKNKLNEFTKLLGVYAGHVHEHYNQTVNNTKYIIEAALVTGSVCGTSATTYVGYTKINTDLSVQYTRLNFNSTFIKPF